MQSVPVVTSIFAEVFVILMFIMVVVAVAICVFLRASPALLYML